MRADLEAEIGQLRETLDTSVVERTRLQRLVEQLQTGYRVPEQWAVHQGRREVLAELATLYQELALSQPVSGPVAEPDHWLTLRLESLLQQHGVSKFGTPGSTDPYNPTLHEYLPGVGGTGSIIQVRCPGFRWQDPAGNAVVLTRAKVVPHR